MSDSPPIMQQTLAGRYVLEREIGRGGSATVFLAHDLRHERRVAIKLLHPELSHALGAQRFMREIKLTASLQHPHILPIHDSGEVDEQLYYVMPFVEGDTLRQRLGATNRLSVEEAVRIGREVAGALAYAHERGVVHRDIKPENILFSGGHAVLADFGIARAINRASEKITQQGTITGTPAYMSPEQARDRSFDGRSDVYSLSCVLYEAIAGVPPYVGDTPQQLLQQRVHRPPPLLREYRYDVPAPIESVIAKALSISPDDRYDDARAFSAALSAAVGNSGETLLARGERRQRLRRPVAIAAGAVLLLVGGAATTPRGRDQFDILARRIDTAQYAIVPFQYVGARAPSSDTEPVASGTYAAMQRWEGLPLANEMSVAEALQEHGDAELTLDDVARIARRVRAGRAVWGRVRMSRDSIVIRAGVYDALTGVRLREVTRVVHPGGAAVLQGMDFHALAMDLLRTSRGASLSAGADRGTRSIAAWRAFEHGAAALARWDVEGATIAFDEAARADPAYPHANLWRAHLAFLRDQAPKEWAAPMMAAAQGRDRLDARERDLTDALGEMAGGDYPAACGRFDAQRRRDSLDAMAWLSLAFCQGRDRAVVRAPHTPTGWAFRSSAERSWRALSRALEIAPEAFGVISSERLRRYAITEHNALRFGVVGDEPYAAYPYRAGDSIAYAPHDMTALATAMEPPEYEAGLRLNRDRLLGLLEVLARRLPESPDVFEALANLLETRDEITGTPNGRYSALTALERARTLSTDDDQHLRLSVSKVRLHLKLGDFAGSASTADSVLRAMREPTASQSEWLAGLAAFTGRGGLAASYMGMHDRESGDPAFRVPAAEGTLAALTMTAALGVCDDSARALIQAVDRTLATYVAPERRTAVRDHLLARPMMLATPCTAGRSALEIAEPYGAVLLMAQRVARGEPAAARRISDSLAARRRAMRPGAVSLDAIVLEAWVLDATGEPAEAARRLDVVLTALPSLSSHSVTEPVVSAAVGRAMVYRAELASRLGDPSAAALWAGRVLTLWGKADGRVAPTLTRMRRLAAHRPA